MLAFLEGRSGPAGMRVASTASGRRRRLPGRRGQHGVEGDGEGTRGHTPSPAEETRAGPHLISWAEFSAFLVLKMSVRCSSRCRSCSHVESLLPRKDRGQSLNTLCGSGEE